MLVKLINILQAAFCANILSPKNYKSLLKVEKSCAKHFHIKKAACKILVKLSPEQQIFHFRSCLLHLAHHERVCSTKILSEKKV